jgi:hypothetical protein
MGVIPQSKHHARRICTAIAAAHTGYMQRRRNDATYASRTPTSTAPPKMASAALSAADDRARTRFLPGASFPLIARPSLFRNWNRDAAVKRTQA